MGRKVHTDIDMWTEIRRKVLVEGASKRSILRDYGFGHQVPAKILVNPEPPDHQVGGPRQKPKLGEFLGVIDEVLEADKTVPVKQRHSGRRIFERLRDKYGYTGGITQVRDAVAQAKRYSKEAFVPLSHPPRHRPVRLRRSDGHDRRGDQEGRPGRDHPALFGHLLSYRLPEGVHRDLPGGPRVRLRVLRRGADAHLLAVPGHEVGDSTQIGEGLQDLWRLTQIKGGLHGLP